MSKDLVFEVHAEGELVCEPVDLLEAIECLIIAYFLLNIKYPPSALNSLTFFQKVLLNVEEKEVSMSRKLQNLLKKLKY